MSFRKQHPRSYQMLWLSVLVFLSLNALMLGLNYRITESIADNALLINLAGRQRMLSQRMAKAVFEIRPGVTSEAQRDRLVSEYLGTFSLFFETLEGFARGGEVRDATGKSVQIGAIDDASAQRIIGQAKSLVEPQVVLYQQLYQKGISDPLLEDLHRLQVGSNEELLQLMNQLTIGMEKLSQAEASSLRLVQLLTFFLALLSFVYVVMTFKRVTQQSQALSNLLIEYLERANVAFIVVNATGELELFNERAQHMFGYSRDEFAGQTEASLFEHSDSGESAIRRDGNRFAVELHKQSIEIENRQLSFITVVDISHHRLREIELNRLANSDGLTGLLNRRALHEILELELRRSDTTGTQLACVFIDLDGFKRINDTYGHEVGDIYLQTLAKRIRNELRQTDWVFRYGGDEFVVLASLPEARHSVEQLLGKIAGLNGQPVPIDDKLTLQSAMSIGVSVYPDQVADANELLRYADEQMYKMKQSGGARSHPPPNS